MLDFIRKAWQYRREDADTYYALFTQYEEEKRALRTRLATVNRLYDYHLQYHTDWKDERWDKMTWTIIEEQWAIQARLHELNLLNREATKRWNECRRARAGRFFNLLQSVGLAS